MCVSAANLAAPQMVRVAIDRGLGPRRWSMVLVAVGGLVAIALGRGLFNFLQGYLAERASQGVAFDLRDALFSRIQRLSFSYYDQAQTGQLLTRLTNDVEQVRTFVGGGVIQLAASLVMLIGCAVILFTLNAALAGVALLTILPIFYVLKIFVTRVGPLFGRVQMTLGGSTRSCRRICAGCAWCARSPARGARPRATARSTTSCAISTSRSSAPSATTSRSSTCAPTSAPSPSSASAGCRSSAIT